MRVRQKPFGKLKLGYNGDAGGECSDFMDTVRNGTLSAVADRLETAKWRE